MFTMYSYILHLGYRHELRHPLKQLLLNGRSSSYILCIYAMGLRNGLS